MVWDTYAFRWIIFELLSTYHFGKMVCFFMSVDTILLSIREIEQAKSCIAKLAVCDTMTVADTAFQIEMLNKQQLKLKKELIDEVHVTKEGTPRKIEYKESKGLWMTIMPDKSKVYGKTKEVVLDKLMEYYGLSLVNLTLQEVFEEALSHKDRTEAVNQETLYHLRSTYKRFISPELSNTSIKAITSDLLAEYTLNALRDAQHVNKQGVTVKVKKKAFLDYKSVLNVIFQYAMDKDIITVNPLAKFKNKVFLKECDCSRAVSDEKIFSESEIADIKAKVRRYMEYDRYNGYFINGYAILLSIETGMRAGELPALKWSDIKSNHIHIHAQQLSNKRKGGKEYYLADWTKDEKGVSRGGRQFPLTREIRYLLDEIKDVQQSKGIHSEFVFCNSDGEWIKTEAYTTCLRRLLKSMGFDITNNHAFRMSLNSNFLIARLHLSESERALYLGHSPETNLKYYTFAPKKNMDDIVKLFDSCSVSPRSHLKLVSCAKKESPEPLISQCF